MCVWCVSKWRASGIHNAESISVQTIGRHNHSGITQRSKYLFAVHIRFWNRVHRNVCSSTNRHTRIPHFHRTAKGAFSWTTENGFAASTNNNKPTEKKMVVLLLLCRPRMYIFGGLCTLCEWHNILLMALFFLFHDPFFACSCCCFKCLRAGTTHFTAARFAIVCRTARSQFMWFIEFSGSYT